MLVPFTDRRRWKTAQTKVGVPWWWEQAEVGRCNSLLQPVVFCFFLLNYFSFFSIGVTAVLYTLMKASRPPCIKVANAAGEIPPLLGVRLQLAVVQLGHSCIINAEFQSKKPQKHSPCFLLHKKKNILDDSSYPAGPITADTWCHFPSLHLVFVLKV